MYTGIAFLTHSSIGGSTRFANTPARSSYFKTSPQIIYFYPYNVQMYTFYMGVAPARGGGCDQLIYVRSINLQSIMILNF
jgi:hypothetical protein